MKRAIEKRKSKRKSPKKSKAVRKSPKKSKREKPISRSSRKKKSKSSSEILKKLSAKYNLQTYASGRPISPKRLAERLNLYAGSKLTKTEKEKILPYLKTKKSKRKSPKKSKVKSHRKIMK